MLELEMNLLSLMVQLCRNGRCDTDRHLLTLFAIALACKGKTYIELGVRDGTTTMPMLLAAYLNGGKLISVDMNPTALKVSGPLVAHWQFVKSDTLIFLEQWTKPIDFIFIDDRHSCEHVKRELDLIGKWVEPSSVILVHDLMYHTDPFYHSEPNLPENHPWGAGGPYRAVAELDLATWEWATLPWGHGLTLLRKRE